MLRNCAKEANWQQPHQRTAGHLTQSISSGKREGGGGERETVLMAPPSRDMRAEHRSSSASEGQGRSGVSRSTNREKRLEAST